jgi:hypothetical protein
MSYSYRIIYDILNENGLVYDARFTKLPSRNEIVTNRHFLLKNIPNYKYALFGFCVILLIKYYKIYPSTINKIIQKINNKFKINK